MTPKIIWGKIFSPRGKNFLRNKPRHDAIFSTFWGIGGKKGIKNLLLLTKFNL